MTELAPWFYDYPAQKMRMIGITGTNGKTTTTNILRTLLTNTGHKVGLIGTINIMIGDEVEASFICSGPFAAWQMQAVIMS